MGSRLNEPNSTNFGISTEIADAIDSAKLDVDRLKGFGLQGIAVFRMFP
jgi:hypothetical protein